MDLNIVIKYLTSNLLDLFIQKFQDHLEKGELLTWQNLLDNILTEINFPLDAKTKLPVADIETWYTQVYDLSFIEQFFNKKNVREIIIHQDNFLQTEENGQLTNHELKNMSTSLLDLTFKTQTLKQQINWNFNTPFASFTTQWQNLLVRMTIIHSSITANNQHKMFIRKISETTLDLKDFAIIPTMQAKIKNLIRNKANIIISGSTGSGKTTLLNSLLNEIPINEHIIILEDTYELINQTPSHTNLIANQLPHKSLKDYCSYALRMRPDRIILGEMRSNEIVPFLLAMNTGHKGLLSTVHANSAADTLDRLATLFCLYAENSELQYSLIMKLICKNIDYVLFMENKKVKEMVKVLGSEGNTPFIERMNSHSSSSQFLIDDSMRSGRLIS